ncbi:MAG: hypothetical protein KDD46_07525 [Bdellovibrionales bacterium]|nr:hypothetical protein [Bdellovibrionales bacterium]
MKKFIFLSCIALAVFSCTSDGGSIFTGDPNDAPFDNPTGELTDENVQDVLEATVDATGASNLNDPFTNLYSGGSGGLSSHTLPWEIFKASHLALTADEVDEECVTEDGDAITYDNECIMENIDGCSGTGTFTVTNSSSELSVVYNNFTFTCGEDDDQFSLDCGTVDINFDLDNTEAFCITGGCSFIEGMEEEEDVSVDACINTDGEWLVNVDDKSFVVNGAEINETCDSITATITDSVGAHTATCDVDADEGCDSDSLDEINTFSNCAVATDME